MVEVGQCLGVGGLSGAGALLESCGEDLGRFDQASAGAGLRRAGLELAAAADACAKLQPPDPESGGGWLAGLTERMVGVARGGWPEAAEDMREAAGHLETAGVTLEACMMGKLR